MTFLNPSATVIKGHLPKGMMYVLKSEAILEAVNVPSQPNLHIQIRFREKQAYFQKGREKLKAEGRMHVIGARFHPLSQPVYPIEWQEKGEIPHLEVEVHAIAADVWNGSRFKKEDVQMALKNHLSFITSKTAWLSPWYLDIQYFSRERRLVGTGKFAAKSSTEESFEWRL